MKLRVFMVCEESDAEDCTLNVMPGVTLTREAAQADLPCEVADDGSYRVAAPKQETEQPQG